MDGRRRSDPALGMPENMRAPHARRMERSSYLERTTALRVPTSRQCATSATCLAPASSITARSRSRWRPSVTITRPSPSHSTLLGRVLAEECQLDPARGHLERALEIKEEALGPGHRETAFTHLWLAYVLRRENDTKGADRQLEHARAAYDRALRIDEAAYGADHPAVARDREDLARCYTPTRWYDPMHRGLGLAAELVAKVLTNQACLGRRTASLTCGPSPPRMARSRSVEGDCS
jgi:tetratricopeptide (TPR) repeat protein